MQAAREAEELWAKARRIEEITAQWKAAEAATQRQRLEAELRRAVQERTWGGLEPFEC